MISQNPSIEFDTKVSSLVANYGLCTKIIKLVENCLTYRKEQVSVDGFIFARTTNSDVNQGSVFYHMLSAKSCWTYAWGSDEKKVVPSLIKISCVFLMTKKKMTDNSQRMKKKFIWAFGSVEHENTSWTSICW